MHVLIFLTPQRRRILLYKLINIWVIAINNFSISSTFDSSYFKFYEIHDRCWFADFEPSILIFGHAEPGVLTSYC